MKPSEIKQELESKSRDELNIIAKKLKIKNRRFNFEYPHETS